MIRINLLGKKAAATVPFGLDEKLGKLGISVDDLKEFQPALIKLVVVVVALYLGEAVPRYFIEKKMQKLEAELQKLTSKAAELQKDLASKKTSASKWSSSTRKRWRLIASSRR